MNTWSRNIVRGAAVGASVWLFAPTANALQPLEQFVASAKQNNVDAAEAAALAQQRVEEARAAWAKLAPTGVARGIYTRNQREIAIPANAFGPGSPSTVITPLDQDDGYFIASLSLVDVGSWLRISGAEATADAAKLRVRGTDLDVEKGVTRAYYQLVAYYAGIDASKKARDASNDNLNIVKQRLAAGAASELDVERARAEVEARNQALAVSGVNYAIARQSLATLSGVVPTEGAMPELADNLVPEPPLQALAPATSQLPNVQASALESKAAERNAQAAYAALAPTVAVAATEHLTNYGGFSGHNDGWAIALTAQWTLDASVYFTARAQSAAHAAAEARQRRTELNARDDLYNAWQQVAAQIAQARAATAQVEATTKAAKLVRDRYTAGAATQLDVTQADRDAFQAEVSRIQALGDLAYARALVKIDTGRGTIAKDTPR